MGVLLPRADRPSLSPSEMLMLLKISKGEAAGFEPWPPGFIPPGLLDPNYVPPNRGDAIFWLSVVMMVLTVLFVAARIYSRARITGCLGVDDWLIIPATGFCALYITSICYAVKHAGLGKHSYDEDFEEIRVGIVALWCNLLAYILTIGVAKISILFFIKRLAGSAASKSMRIFFWSFFAFQLSFMIFKFLAFAMQCTPIAAGYDISLRLKPGSSCKNYVKLYYGGSAVHAITDIILLALPIFLTWNLKMRRERKIAIISMFAIGGLACICSLCRVAFLGRFATTYDLAWESYWPAMLGMLECTLAIITSSCPALKPLFVKVIPGLTQRRSTFYAPKNSKPGASSGVSRSSTLHNAAGSPYRKSGVQLTWTNTQRTIYEGDSSTHMASVSNLVEELSIMDIELSDVGGLARSPSERAGPGQILKTTSVDITYQHRDI